MKRILSFLLTLMLICGFAFPALTVQAYNKPMASVSATPSSVVVGKNVTVTIKHSASDGKIGALDYQISYNAKVLEYVSSEGSAVVNGADGALAASWYDFKGAGEVVVKLTFKTIAAGKADVKVTTTTFADEAASEFPLPSEASATVTVLNEEPKSNNANLKAVDVVANDADGKKLTSKLSPAFSAGVVSYTVTVPHNTNSVSINSTVADGKATSKIEGPWGAVAGDWVRKVIVTAEDGVTQKTYTFKIVKDKAPTTSTPDTSSKPEVNDDLRVIVENKEYNVVTDISKVQSPEGFKKDIAKYNGVEIPCFISNDSSLILVCLADSEGETALFSYNAEQISFSTCDISQIGAGEFIILDAAKYTDDVKDFTVKEVMIGNKKINAYRFADSGEFVLVWAIGNDGEGKLYVYDTAGKTLQRYASIHKPLQEEQTPPTVVPPTDDSEKETGIDFDIVMIGLAVLVGIILILLVAWIAALVRLKRAYPPKTDELDFVPFFDDDDTLIEFSNQLEENSAEDLAPAEETAEEIEESQEIQE